MKNKTENWINVRSDEETKELLKKLAEKNCRSMAEQVKYLIKQAAEAQGIK